jgi:tetratricopeptide (TPR) repeat protein
MPVGGAGATPEQMAILQDGAGVRAPLDGESPRVSWGTKRVSAAPQGVWHVSPTFPRYCSLWIGALVMVSGCSQPSGAGSAHTDGRVATSLLGRPLLAEEIPAARRLLLEAELDAAKAAYAENPRDEQRTIWLGRRLAYLGRYKEAIQVFTDGLQLHPESYRLLRHRAHRLITLRRFDEALADLSRAAALARDQPDAVEPDGVPNAQNLPRTTDHSNIYYHLGLVHYLRGEYAEAERGMAQREGLAGYNDDMLVSTTHWRYLALRRMGRIAEAEQILAPIQPEMDVIENHSYHRLCLMYKGLVSRAELLPAGGEPIADAAVAYGVGAFLDLNGQREEAESVFERIIRDTSWAAFGHIAAEADLARWRSGAGASTRGVSGVSAAPRRPSSR